MFLDFISQNFEAEDVVFESGSVALTQRDVLSRVSLLRKQYATFLDQVVLIKVDDQLNNILALLSMEGFASKIVLVPSDTTPEFMQRIESQTGSTQYINDSTFDELPGIRAEKTEVQERIATRVVMATSGTTGIPKLIEHDVKSLTSTTKKNKSDKRFVWGLVYKVNRFAGMQVLLQAISGGNKLVLASGNYDVEEDLELFVNGKVNCLSATPTYWRKMLMLKKHKDLCLVNITLGGETSNQSILNALRSAYPDANLRHIYASTEAGVGFSVVDGKEGFPLSFMNEGISGVEMKLSNDGELLIKKVLLDQKYTNLENDIIDGFLKTGDLVEVVGQRVLFLGRKSGIINVGGTKVVPEKIEKVISDLEGVVDAHVFPMRSSMMGSLVAVKIIKSDKELSAKVVKEMCSDKLNKQEIPAVIKFVESFDVTQTGKVKRA